MMLSYPVALGLLCFLLLHSSSGTPQVSGKETNKVYSYSYHFQHNGTTNSQDILRTVLGNDPDFGIDPPEGQSIVKTISSPNIRGFFTRGVLPAGPSSSFSWNNNLQAGFNTRSAIDDIKKVVEANIIPPRQTGLLTPISPDIANEFPGDYNNVGFQKPDFPAIPQPQLPFSYQNNADFPRIPEVSNNFPNIPSPVTHNNGVSRVESFSRNTPDGGKVEGQIETFEHNPPATNNLNSNYQENSQGFRRNENFVNNNQEVTGHRTQSYFRQQFRTVTPNVDNNNGIVNRVDVNNVPKHENNGVNGNRNNQWWNALNVLGKNNNKNPNNAINLNVNNAYDSVNPGNMNNINFNSRNGNNNNFNTVLNKNNNRNNFNLGNINNNNNNKVLNEVSNPLRENFNTRNAGNNLHNNLSLRNTGVNSNYNSQNAPNFNQQVNSNINQMRNNINKEFNRAFGTRLSSLNNRQNNNFNNHPHNVRQNTNNGLNNITPFINNPNIQNNVRNNANNGQNNQIYNNNINRQDDVRQNINNVYNNLNLLNKNINPIDNIGQNVNNQLQNENLHNRVTNNVPFSNQFNNNIPINKQINSNNNFNNAYPNHQTGNIGHDPANNQQHNLNNNAYPNHQRIDIGLNNQQINLNNNNAYPNIQTANNDRNDHQKNLNKQFDNDDTTKKVLNIINDVGIHLNKLNNNNNAGPIKNNNNNPRLTWDDDFVPIFNNDWSRRHSNGNGRPFSNAHSGPLLSQPQPVELLKSTIDAIVAGRDVPVVPISDMGPNQNGGNYRHVGGGGTEKFFGSDRVMHGPNSISRNQQRGYERNLNFNSDIGHQRNNQWSTNTVRRLDAQSSKSDFSKDFIDVFRDDY